MADAAALLESCDIALLSGDDPLTLPLMSVGAVGVVSVLSNLIPRSVKRLTTAALNGDFAAARRLDEAALHINRSFRSNNGNVFA